MLGPVLLTLSLAAAPATVDPVAVIVTSERVGAAEAADAVATQVHQALVREGWAQTLDVAASAERVKATGFADPRKCKGARSCVSKLAVLLGARAVVVSVDVGKLGGTLAIHLEAVAADDERSLEVTDVTAGTDLLAEKSALPVTLFARAVAAKLKARAAVAHAPRPGDAPTATTLTPGPGGLPADGELTEASTEPSLAAPIAVTALTGAAAIATVALVVVASGARSQYEAAKVTDGSGTGTTLTRAEADALAGKANGCFSAAWGTGIATGVGAVLSGWLWASRAEPAAE